MDAVASGALSGAAQGASMGMVAGPWGAAIGAVAGGIYGGVQGDKKKKANKAASLEAAEIKQQEVAAEQALADSEYKKKQLAQWNATESEHHSQDPSYNNPNFSSISGTNTLPTSNPTQQTQMNEQIQALGFG